MTHLYNVGHFFFLYLTVSVDVVKTKGQLEFLLGFSRLGDADCLWNEVLMKLLMTPLFVTCQRHFAIKADQYCSTTCGYSLATCTLDKLILSANDNVSSYV